MYTLLETSLCYKLNYIC